MIDPRALARVREHLGYKTFDSAAAAALEPWLGERAVEHDAPGVLLALTAQHLHARTIIRPSLDRLLRLIATARAAAHIRIEAAVADQLAPERRTELDALLIAPAGGRSELARLKERAGRVGVAEPGMALSLPVWFMTPSAPSPRARGHITPRAAPTGARRRPRSSWASCCGPGATRVAARPGR